MRPPIYFIVSVVLLVLVLGVVALHARPPAPSPVSPQASPAAQPTVLWERDTSLSQTVQPLNDRVLVADKNTVQAFDPLTGETLWQASLADGKRISTLLPAGAAVVAVVRESRPDVDSISLHALDPATGERQWSADGYLDPIDSGVKPFVTPNHLYVGDTRNTLRALNIETGAVEWEVGLGERVYLRPLARDGLVFYTLQDGSLVGADDRTGQPVWTTPIEDGITAILDRRAQREVYKGFAQDGLLVVWDDAYLKQTLAASGRSPVLRAFDARTGRRLWTSPYTPHYDSPLLRDQDHLYSMTWASPAPPHLYALDVTDGRVRFDKVLARETGEKVKVNNGPWEPVLEPAGYPATVIGETLVLNGNLATIYGLDRHSGETQWTQAGGTSYYRQTVIRGEVGYFAFRDADMSRINASSLRAIDLKTGRVLWSLTDQGGRYYELYATDRALIVRGLRKLVALRWPD